MQDATYVAEQQRNNEHNHNKHPRHATTRGRIKGGLLPKTPDAPHHEVSFWPLQEDESIVQRATVYIAAKRRRPYRAEPTNDVQNGLRTEIHYWYHPRTWTGHGALLLSNSAQPLATGEYRSN